MKALHICAFYVFALIHFIHLSQNIMFSYWSCVLFSKIKNNMVCLLLVTSVSPQISPSCYGLGFLAMTAFTHDVCALFCKSVVVVFASY